MTNPKTTGKPDHYDTDHHQPDHYHTDHREEITMRPDDLNDHHNDKGGHAPGPATGDVPSGHREPVPGCPRVRPLLEDVEMHICGSCFELRMPRQAGNQVAADWCRCDWANRTAPKPVNPGNDLGGMNRLCWCCTSTVVTGCSKFSVMVCSLCKDEIQSLSAHVGRRVAPIGRHSIHMGVGVRTDLPYDRSDLVELADSLTHMVSSIHAADGHRRARTAELAHRFGLFGRERIDLWEYLARCGAEGTRSEGLASLMLFSSDRDAWEAVDPGFRRSVLLP